MGFPELYVSNQVLLCKLLWKLVSQSQALCSQILTSKYGGWRSLLLDKKFPSKYVIWKGITHVLSLYQRSFCWKLGNDRKLRFRLDYWFEEHPLLSESSSLLPSKCPSISINGLWINGNGWNVIELGRLLLPNTIRRLQLVSLKEDEIAEDQPSWNLHASGHFSTASLSRHLLSSARIHSWFPWHWIWKFRGPSRASFALWSILHKAFSTDLFLWKGHIISFPLYEWCNREVQFTSHLLHDCNFSRQVWNLIADHRWWPQLYVEKDEDN